MFDAGGDRADERGVRRALQGRPSPFPVHRLARGRRRDDRPARPSPATSPSRWKPISARGSIGSPSITGTPTIRTSISSCAASTKTGADLVISRDYISRGLRSRAEDLVAIELGPKPEHEIRNALEREVAAERWTRLDARDPPRRRRDRHHRSAPEQSGARDPEIRRLMIGRLQHLEKMGLAASAGPGEWMVGLEAERAARPRHARRHHQDHAPRLHRARRGSRRRRLCHRRRTARRRRSSADWSTRACMTS